MHICIFPINANNMRALKITQEPLLNMGIVNLTAHTVKIERSFKLIPKTGYKLRKRFDYSIFLNEPKLMGVYEWHV